LGLLVFAKLGAAAFRSLPRIPSPSDQGAAAAAGGTEDRQAEVSLLPSLDLVEDRRKELTPIALGSLDANDGSLWPSSESANPSAVLIIMHKSIRETGE
jgi:hypothetical protein